ncbi:MAG: SO_0444 family Cu/Zn efflux transporter [Planctomycetes bacterium]|nr:SO_0444 family Cu/Zn efflux transporter [Planctomycetota bacterium]
MDSSTYPIALLLLAVSLAGALLPLFRRWSERGLHLFVAVAAGIFLGTIFLHLLPELAGVELAGHGEASEHGAGPSMGPWIAALAGLLLLFALERVWLRSLVERSGPNVHASLWVATYLGLSLHSLTAGVALTAILHNEVAQTQFLISYLVHKASESFSLATVMRLAHLRTGTALVLLLGFAAIEPLALLGGSQIFEHHPSVDGLLTGFACGTFLYVAVCDLLPEVFHGAERPRLKLVAVVVGVLSTAFTAERGRALLRFLESVGLEAWSILRDMAPFLLVGFLLAGLLHRFLRTDWLVKKIAGNDFASVCRAALVGAPLPLCSCSVVPVAVEMRKRGASKGATAAFLISTPETGVDSVSVSWALLDPVLTIARPVGAVISALVSGSLVNALVRRGLDRESQGSVHAAAEEAGCCAHGGGTPEHLEEHEHADTPSGILRYAFVEMLDDLAPSLVLGLVLSAAISVLLPVDLLDPVWRGGLPGMLLMLLLGIPVYVCAAASTPVAASLIHKGFSPGTALVFLLVGPATNLSSLVVLARSLGRRTVLTMLAGLALSALLLGACVDWLYSMLAIEPVARLGEHAHGLPAALSNGCALLFLALLCASLLRSQVLRRLARRAPPASARS